ncbi:MAG: archease [Anaerolineales bacterium]|nr:archease [Anaerolineales bacterium]
MQGFEIVDHTADWAIRVTGRSLADLLVNAAAGMNSLLVGDLAVIPRAETRQLALAADDAETLLVDWLTELAYWAEMEQRVFPDVQLSLMPPFALQATLQGGRAPELQKHIKAVTYHDLAVVETAEGLETTIVFDV